MREDVLKITGLQAGYGDITVLWDVTLTVPSSGITSLIGSNGAGKTTLMRAISGLVDIKGGAIEWLGNRIEGASPASVLEGGVAHVPEGRRLFGPMTVEENLQMGAFLRKESSRELYRDLERVYSLFPRLKERRSQAAGTLSGGEQQMCAIGRGLMSAPRLLMIDELSLGLSPLLVEQLTNALRQLAIGGLGIFLVEQDVATALELADTAFVMDRGRIVRSGAARDLAADDAVREAYIGVMH